MNCAPGRLDKRNKSCLSDATVLAIAGAYNNYVSKDALLGNRKGIDLIDLTMEKKDILRRLHLNFQSECHGDEICITKQEFLQKLLTPEHINEIEKSYLAKGPLVNEWLSNEDIDEVMSRYQFIHSDFLFMGALPRDCSVINSCPLYMLDFAGYEKQGITKIGIIYNMDKYGESGSHWVSCLMDLNKNILYFSNSGGDPPYKEMNNMISDFKRYIASKRKNATVKINGKRYQKDRSECGVYSLNFIIRLLNGTTFEEIIENPLNFKEINSCRNVYFRNDGTKNTSQRCEI